eukprot:108680_1
MKTIETIIERYVQQIWIGMVSVTYVLGFIQIYAYIKFKSMKKLFIVQRRYPSLVMAEAIVVLIYLFIAQPLYTNNMLHVTHSSVSLIENTKVCIGYIFMTSSLHFIIWTETTRLWLISFDLNYLNSLKNQSWKEIIDNNSAKTDWFFRNRSKWGNQNYVVKRVLIWYLISVPIMVIKSCVLFLIYPDFFGVGRGIEWIFFMIPISITIYTYHKCPKNLNDNFFFHYEFTTICFTDTTAYVLMFLSIGFYLAGFKVICFIANFFISVGVLTIPSLLSTYWILRKIKKTNLWNHAKYIVDDLTIITEVHYKQKKNSQNIDVDDRLRNILRKEHHFELLVHWMYREFSLETISSFIEFTQCKHRLKLYIEDTLGKNVNNNDVQEYICFDQLIKSSIVYGQENQNENQMDLSRDIAHSLYIKYIAPNAELEINISWVMRNKYQKLDKSNYPMDVVELYTVFDDIIDEMFQLMLQSFVRFEQQEHTSEEYSFSGIELEQNI